MHKYIIYTFILSLFLTSRIWSPTCSSPHFSAMELAAMNETKMPVSPSPPMMWKPSPVPSGRFSTTLRSPGGMSSSPSPTSSVPCAIAPGD